jgi:hypothetical protein
MVIMFKNTQTRNLFGADDNIILYLTSKLKENNITLWHWWMKGGISTLSVSDAQQLIATIEQVIIELIELIKLSPLPRFREVVFLNHRTKYSHLYEEDKALDFFSYLHGIIIKYIDYNEPITIKIYANGEVSNIGDEF